MSDWREALLEGDELGVREGFAALLEPRPGERSDDELLDELFDELADEGAIGAIDHELAQPEPQPQPPPQAAPPGVGPRWLALGLVGVAAVLGILWLGLDLDARLAREGLGEAAAGDPGSAAAMLAEDRPEIAVARPGERHRLRADDCRRVGAELSLCTGSAARIRVDERSDAGQVVVDLEAGTVEIDSSGSATPFDIGTDFARIAGRDSRFELAIDPLTAQLLVRVSVGEVEVQIGHERVVLEGGASSSFAPPRSGEATEQPEPPLEPELQPEPEPQPQASEAADARPASAEELLAAAQRALGAKRRDDAMAHYRELIQRYPDSRAGRTARLSLGRLLLAGGDHAAALTEFDAYLEGPAGARSLSEEALYGRIRCLRGLARGDQAEAAIAEFLRRYPNSIHRARLEDWAAKRTAEAGRP